MNIPRTGQDLYALYTKKEEELNNCVCEGWEILADEEQNVWDAMASALNESEQSLQCGIFSSNN